MVASTAGENRCAPLTYFETVVVSPPDDGYRRTGSTAHARFPGARLIKTPAHRRLSVIKLDLRQITFSRSDLPRCPHVYNTSALIKDAQRKRRNDGYRT
jgi:hypothetical protein